MRINAVRALLAAGRFRFTSKCELIDQNGVYRDVTAWQGTNWFDSATWTENADQPVSTGTVVLAREDRGVSMAPAIGGSPINQLGAVYSPFLVEGRGVRLSIAVTPEGTAPVGGDFVEVFVGQYDSVGVSSDSNQVTLNIRDRGAFIVDTFVREKKVYADDEGGESLETVIQAILNDTLGIGVVPLYVPVPTGTMVHHVEVDHSSLMEAVRNVALMIGWDVRYRYDAGGVSRLTLMRPVREAATGAEATWFTASEYIAVPRLDTSVIDVRNVVRVDFTNADTGEPDFVEIEDAASVAKYGARWMQLAFAATSSINTTDEATTLANAALSDMAYPFSDHDVELFPAFWPAQLGDFYGFRANGKVYDTDQSAGVFGFTHTLENASGSTTLVTKARVVGAWREWQRRSDSERGIGASDTPDTRVLALKNFREVRRTPTAVTFGWDDVSAEVDAIWAWGKLSPQDADPPLPPGADEDRLWRDTKTETPDLILDTTTKEFEVAVPDFGNVQTWELLPVDVASKRGFAQRIKVLSVPDVPRITSLETTEGASGLFKDVSALNVVDPQALGGTLRAWLSRNTIDDGDPTLPPDGTIAVAITPHTFTASDTFDLPGGGTAQIFDNVRIHPGKGKHVFFEFVNTRGISSGIVGYILLSNGGIIDSNGELLDESINRASQIAATMTMPSVYDTLPATGRANELAVLTTDGKLYRWTGSAWTAAVPAVDITGVLTAAQIADYSIGLTKIATSIAAPEILNSLPASPGINRLAYLTTDGKLYRSTPDGSAWTAAVPTGDITGQIIAAQIAAGAVTATKILDGSITTPKLVTGAVTANEIAAGAVVAGKIGALAITAAELAANSVVAGKIAAAAVNTTELAANAITAAKIGAGEVITSHMAANTINGDRIQANTLNASKIVALSITSNELAANSVIAAKIAAAAVTATAIDAGAVTAVKISVTLLSQVATNAGIIVAGKLQDATGARFLDLSATGSNPFLSHPSMTLRADGTATFGGVVTATSFTGANATFSNGMTVGGATLFVTGGNFVIFGSGAAPLVGPNGNDLLLQPKMTGTVLNGSVVRPVGGIPGTPAPMPVVVIDAVGGVFPTAANYRQGDILVDIVNVVRFVMYAGAWAGF